MVIITGLLCKKSYGIKNFSETKQRCKKHRIKILQISQKVKALHIAGAFSSIEMIDYIYYQIIKNDKDIKFILSKGMVRLPNM